jgi:hypothetical protein
MPTMTETNGTGATADHALMPIESTSHELALSGTLASLASDAFTVIDQELHAARRQIVRGTQEATEGWIRFAIALLRMRNTRAYLQAGYPNFRAYLQQCHDLSEETALRCVQALEAFGPDTFRELLSNFGVMRTYYLALIQQLSPPVFDELLALPPGAEQPVVAALEVSDLEQLVADLKAQLQQAYAEHDQLADQLAAAKQIGSTIKTRLAEIEKMNQDLVAARDRAEREVERVKEQRSRPPASSSKRERELEHQIQELQQQLTAAHAALQLAAPPAQSPEARPGAVLDAAAQEVIATCDPTLLADLLESCVASLRRYHELAPDVAPDQARSLYAAIAELIAAGDLALLIPVVRACATALRRYPDPTALPPDTAQELYAALDAFGPAAVAVYPKEAVHD